MAQPPSSPDDVLQALALALSPDPSQRSHSLSLLQNWATLPGYYALLTGIFTARQGVPPELRLQAALQFKNGVDKYWRKGAQKCVHPSLRTPRRSLDVLVHGGDAFGEQERD